MKKIIIFLVILALLILIGAIVFRLVFMPSIENSQQQQQISKISEGGKIKDTIKVAGDNYLGYWFLNSREFKLRLAQNGYAINWTNDNGNYAERAQKFSEGKYDIIVLPVNSYIYHGVPNYPGLIVAALSDSKGADNIVGYKSTFGSQPKVNALNDPQLKIGVTPDSPSSFLLDTAIAYFDLNKIKGQKFIETNGSDDALVKLRNKQLDVAVLWQPNVSQALQDPGIVSIYGSDQIAGMIIDVFVVHNNILLTKPDMTDAFFKAYFETLGYYSDNKEEMIQEMSKTTAFKSTDDVKKALDTIAWCDLKDNHDNWFGKDEKIVRTIIQVKDIMLDNKELQSDPLQGNPYKIISTKFVVFIF
jgi:ABC-type nitrate/sulfonate/bicarbonate transport system substrate-binding protein